MNIMKFSDYQYQRVPLNPIPPEISSIPEKIDSAQSQEEFLELLGQADGFKRKLATMYNICYIRHTINTQDEFYSRGKRLLRPESARRRAVFHQPQPGRNAV